MSIYKICLTISLSLHLTRQKDVYSGKGQLTRSWTEANQIEAPPGSTEPGEIHGRSTLGTPCSPLFEDARGYFRSLNQSHLHSNENMSSSPFIIATNPTEKKQLRFTCSTSPFRKGLKSRPGMLVSLCLNRDLDYTCVGRLGFPGGASGNEPGCRKHKRSAFDPWIGKIPWRRAWQPTPVLLPGESHGQRNLVGYSP